MGKETAPMYIVEAFTTGNNDPFTGNTAAVCILDFDDDLTDDYKQKLGMNMNLSETAFVAKGWKKGAPFTPDSNAIPLRWTIRWFTPTVEADICGHATLASANILFHQVLKKLVAPAAVETTITFESKYFGQLGATITWSTGLITINFPENLTTPVTNHNYSWLNALTEKVLGPNLGPEALQDVHYNPAMKLFMIRLRDTLKGHAANEAQILKAAPDFPSLHAIRKAAGEPKELLLILLTIAGSKKEGEPNFYSRFFAPWSGIDEDPVTGSAHTVLTPFWNKEFQKDGVNLSSFYAIQSSPRGGKLICTLEGDRVFIKGTTRLVVKGNFIF